MKLSPMKLVLLASLCTHAVSCKKDSKTDEEKAAEAAQSETIAVGTGPTFSDVTTSSYTVSWTAATPSVAGTALEYQLVRAASEDLLDTLAEATSISGTDVVLPWAADTLSFTVTGAAAQETVAYAVLVKDASGNTSLYAPASVTTLEEGAPTPGTALVSSAATHTGFHLAWGAATDPNSLAVTYKVVYATDAASINTVEKAEAITGAGAGSWISAVSADVTGLTLATSYAAAVLVKNSAGKMSLYAPVTQSTLPMRIFVTAGTHSPVITPAIADAFCNADSAKPAGTETYKALIAFGGTSTPRTACLSSNCTASGAAEHADWIFAANTSYGRADGTLIGKTTALALLPDPLVNTISPSRLTSTWGGMTSTWQIDATHNCTDWTSTSGSVSNYGIDVTPFYKDAAHWLGGMSSTCDNNNSFVCVEQ